MNRHPIITAVLMGIVLCATSLAQGLAPGDKIEVTLRGVPAEEQSQVNGTYKVGESGAIRTPGLADAVPARGLTGDQLARRLVDAYKKAGIYTKPAIEVEVLTGIGKGDETTFVNIGGRVRKAGNVPYRKGMTLLEAIQGAGDLDEFAGNRIEFRRAGKLYELNYKGEDVKNFKLEPNDNIRVLERGF